MTFRFQFIKRPKTSILETPEQAYLIIEGASTYHRMSTRKVNRTRCSSTSHYSRSSYCKKQSHERKKHTHQHGNTSRVKRCDSQHKYKICQHYGRPSHRESVKEDMKEDRKGRQTNQRVFSFRNTNLVQPKDPIVCNYQKRVEQQNLLLRKQNKFLQQYVQVLQNRANSIRPTTVTRITTNAMKASRAQAEQFGQNCSSIGIGSFVKKNSDFERTHEGQTECSTFQKAFNRDDDIYSLYRKS